jgi:hypothetical protein
LETPHLKLGVAGKTLMSGDDTLRGWPSSSAVVEAEVQMSTRPEPLRVPQAHPRSPPIRGLLWKERVEVSACLTVPAHLLLALTRCTACPFLHFSISHLETTPLQGVKPTGETEALRVSGTWLPR